MRLPFSRVTPPSSTHDRGTIRALAQSALALPLLTALLAAAPEARAQGVDCVRLQALIAQTPAGGGNARGARRQEIELSRAQAYGHQLGCDQSGFSFFGASQNPQCPAINARIRQISANLAQAQAGGGGGREGLVARFNAYCRGQQQPRERGFFESLFGSHDDPPPGPPPDAVPGDDQDGGDRDGMPGVHGGSQALCVRTCDGGFFPLPMSSHHDADSLNDMCTALCPGTEASVYTRSPDADIKTAVALDGKPYMNLANALVYQKSYSPSCSCHPAGKSWAEALAHAEDVLGSQRKGDIMVTQEKSDELSRPQLDPKSRAALLQAPGTVKASPELAGTLAADPPKLNKTEEVVGPDGVKRLVRRVGPQP